MIIIGLIVIISVLGNLVMLYIFDNRLNDLEDIFWENFGRRIDEK